MYVYCDICGYDSGDEATAELLAAKVIEDGGQMEKSEDDYWDITCPEGHTDGIHMD